MHGQTSCESTAVPSRPYRLVRPIPRDRRALVPRCTSLWAASRRGALDDNTERFGACMWFRPQRVRSAPEPRSIVRIIAIGASWERCLCCWAMPTDMKQPNCVQAWFWRLRLCGGVDVADTGKRAPKSLCWRTHLMYDTRRELSPS